MRGDNLEPKELNFDFVEVEEPEVRFSGLGADLIERLNVYTMRKLGKRVHGYWVRTGDELNLDAKHRMGYRPVPREILTDSEKRIFPENAEGTIRRAEMVLMACPEESYLRRERKHDEESERDRRRRAEILHESIITETESHLEEANLQGADYNLVSRDARKVAKGVRVDIVEERKVTEAEAYGKE